MRISDTGVFINAAWGERVARGIIFIRVKPGTLIGNYAAKIIIIAA